MNRKRISRDQSSLTPLIFMPDDSWGAVVPKRESAKQDLTPFVTPFAS